VTAAACLMAPHRQGNREPVAAQPCPGPQYRRRAMILALVSSGPGQPRLDVSWTCLDVAPRLVL